MEQKGFHRKLTAILSADVAGYSRLMQDDEAATVKTLEAYKQIISDLVKQHRGRVVDSPGDNLLAEFASVVDAVQCAVAIQKELQARNTELPENRKMQFRIGVNLGDVIEEGSRIYGDGVNIAARLESLADHGGICVSKTAFDQIETKLPFGYEYLGEQSVKNIAKAVGAYRVLMEPRVTVAGAMAKAPTAPLWRNKTVAVGAVVVLVMIIGGAVWNFFWRAPKIEPASVRKMAFPLPDRPSIAVLPFTNMSGDPKEDCFSDGLTEDIITALSKTPKIFVIARNSTFSYKGKSVRVQQVSEELGVRYVLEGSFRSAGDRVRITAQLLDALTGQQLWAERYDRDSKNIFAVQDEITKNIITAMQVKLTEGEWARVYAKGTNNLDAYLKAMESMWLRAQTSKENTLKAQQLAEEAIALDSNYAYAYCALALTHMSTVWLGISKSPQESLKRAIELCEKAISLDNSLAIAHVNLGYMLVMTRDYDKAIAQGEKAMAFEPSSADILHWHAAILFYSARVDESIPLFRQALRLNPMPPNVYYRHFGVALRDSGQYDEAIALLKRAIEREPNDLVASYALTSTFAMAGRMDEALAAAKEVLRIDPSFSVERWEKMYPMKAKVAKDRVADALRKAGLPDKPPLPLPDKPSIAILPFVNMSDDRSQEYFSDGLTEEIITALSKTPKLFVIARNSSFVYKGKPVNVQQVSRELGVRYVLEGSVRRSGDQLRITAQLIDAVTGNHLWAERYDREMKDIFAIQDEITMKIINAMEITLTKGEQARLVEIGTKNLEAYLKVLQGIEHYWRYNRADNTTAIERFKGAIAIDPDYAMAYARLASAYWIEAWLGFGKSSEESIAQGLESSQKAISLNDSLPFAYHVLGGFYLLKREHEKAISEGKKAIILSPNLADGYAWLGQTLTFAGKPEEAIPNNEMAIRLDPFARSSYFHLLGMAYREAGRYEQAIAACQEAIRRQSNNVFAHLILASTYIMVGRESEARVEAAEVLRINPQFSMQRFAKVRPHIDPENTARFIDALRKAGLPE